MISASMHLGNQGTAFLSDGGILPGGPYPVYASLEVDADGAALGEVHFACEPKHPAPISVGTEFDLHVPHPDSILADNVNLRVKLVDDSGSVTGYVIGSTAQFRPLRKVGRSSAENSEDDLLPVLRRKAFDQDLIVLPTDASNAEPASMLMLDLDHFKEVNDTYGHPIGDEVLVDCAKTIARRCRHKGKAYRFGGEEFAVLLPNFTVSEAVALAESIRSELEKSKMSSKQLSITVSIGLATVPDHATDGKQLLKAADDALYAAKHLGRNLVRIAGEPSDVKQVATIKRRLPDAAAKESPLAIRERLSVQAEVLKEYPDGPFLPVTTDRDVSLLQLDYLDESGAKLDSEAVNQFGQDFNILIDNRKLTLINNLKHTNGRSFPIKFRMRMQLEGRQLTHEVPALVEPSMKHINGMMT